MNQSQIMKPNAKIWQSPILITRERTIGRDGTEDDLFYSTGASIMRSSFIVCPRGGQPTILDLLLFLLHIASISMGSTAKRENLDRVFTAVIMPDSIVCMYTYANPQTKWPTLLGTMHTLSAPSSTRVTRVPLPLTCVAVALSTARPSLDALADVHARISSYLDYSACFPIPRACARCIESEKLHLLERIDARERTEETTDAVLCRQYAFTPGTALAAERGNLCVLAWLCRVYYPQGRITVAVEKVAQAGHMDVLERLYVHHGNVFWARMKCA
ncbi:hypothetical protein PsorP6_016023 [Peronosclerospora sorghi]|uniref:Uncharacterized protein n=1 Tax=Peronosclerospora sorghi TaxID=230839 RepID=A0ACC0WNV6_9STRA|nr:hypothetical protein PsorP6_016023 [Peronosclerospora sorghi]